MFFKHTTPTDAPLMAAAVVGACRINGWSDDFQPLFLTTVFKSLMSYDCDFLTLPSISVEQFAKAIPERGKRNEVIDLMLAVEMLCSEIPQAVSDSITSWANQLGIENSGLALVRDLAKKSIAQAQQDFYRTNYYHDKALTLPKFAQLEKQHGINAVMLTLEESTQVTAQFESLENCPAGSLGRGLWDFYKKRGFSFPGVVGGVNQSVAHHDWIHVLAEYDSDGIGEMEVGAYSSMATESPAAVMAFLGVLSIFQGGLLKTIVGSAAHLGHELEVNNGPKRIADALRRGRECSIDLITDINFFDYANRQLTDLRREWNIVPKGL
jgi:hypothetical protein